MSKALKSVGKIFSGVTKLATKIVKTTVDVVKKYGKYIAMAAAVYFTAGAAMSMFAPTAGFAASMPGISSFTGMLGLNATAATGGSLTAGAAGVGASAGVGAGAGAAAGAGAGLSAAAGAAGAGAAAGGATAMSSILKAQLGLQLIGTTANMIAAIGEPSQKDLIRENFDARYRNQKASVFGPEGGVQPPAMAQAPPGPGAGTPPPPPGKSGRVPMLPSPGAGPASAPESRPSMFGQTQEPSLLAGMEDANQEAQRLAEPSEEEQARRRSVFDPYQPRVGGNV